jgi:CRP/FNR family cyclic AMP-dependent transcriptional regulator
MQPTPLKVLGLSPQQRADLLEQSAWSLSFNRSDLMILVEFMKACSGGPGTVLCKEGDTESFMGIVIEGSATVLKSSLDGSSKAVGRLGKDKSFGEMAVLNREPRSATVVADTDVRLLVLPRAEFDRLLDSQPKVAAKFLLRIARLLSQRLRETTGQLAEQLS